MNPEDDGTTISPVEVASEEYIGAMQNVCDAVERWMSLKMRETEEEFVEQAELEVRIVLDGYLEQREALRKASETARELAAEQ